MMFAFGDDVEFAQMWKLGYKNTKHKPSTSSFSTEQELKYFNMCGMRVNAASL